MMLSGTVIGLILGFLVGLANAAILWRLADKYPWMKAVAVADVVIMTGIGWAIGAYVFEGNI